MSRLHILHASVVATTLLVTLFSFATTLAQVPRSQVADDHGRAVFIEKGCANCHAIYGHGVGETRPKGGPDLGEKEIYGTYLELAATMWNHFPKMLKRFRDSRKAFPSFTEKEVDEIVSFLSYIRYQGEPGNERTGRKLLGNKKCKVCHTFGGEGGDIGPDFTQSKDYLSPLAFAAAMWNHGPEMNAIFDENDIDRPEFNGREIVDLSVAVRSFMRPTRIPVGSSEPGSAKVGASLVAKKSCDQCHTANGSGGSDAVAFDEMELESSVTEIAGNMWNHGPDMWEKMADAGITFPKLDAQEMADIVAYIYERQLRDGPGNVLRGAGLVYDKGCVSCHSAGGKGAGLGPDFQDLEDLDTPLAMISRMWNHAEDMDEAVRERKKQWPRFTGKDLADIHAYLRSVSGATGGQ